MTDSTNSRNVPGFDPEGYRQAYPDVALSGLDPETHYRRYGQLLGRPPAPAPDAEPPILFPSRPLDRATPADLDRLYAAGPIRPDTPVRHDDLISLIIPSYNNEGWLARALHSALSQSGVKLEIILVDDGSTDGSVALARQIAQTASNLRVISLLRNFGCYYARNIGLQHASGTWIGILDSDDIMAPDRLARQMDALRDQPDAIAVRCQQRRWSADFMAPLSDVKPGENSLLWRRDLLDTIGYYDTVRYSGDAEFRLRLQRSYGQERLRVMPEELYFLRTLDSSLTTSGTTSQVFSIDNAKLKVALSPSRQAYLDNFTDFQKRNKPAEPDTRGPMHQGFPQFRRSFELGSPAQNASPSLDQRRIGAMASFPARHDSLRDTLPGILDQLDTLILYLNDYEEVPGFARDPRVRAILGRQTAGDLRDNGKFYDLPADEDCYIFTFDDDIYYPRDYVARMIHQIELLGRSCVVGIHGVIFPEGPFSNLDQRTVLHFEAAHQGHFVDLLGTGTTAWHSSILRPTLEAFPTRGLCDLWFAAEAARRSVPLYSVPRGNRWLQTHTLFEQSLYMEALDRPDGYFETYHAHLQPALAAGRTRQRMEAQLVRGYDAATLAAAGIELRERRASTGHAVTPTRRTMRFHPATAPRAPAGTEREPDFHIVINGWNCREYLSACLRSIAEQRPGPYRYSVTLIDDGSDDGTFDALAGAGLLPGAQLVRIERNLGPAHARHVGIRDITDPDSVVVLVDMDDALEPDALFQVARRYLDDPACLMTIGNWHDQDGNRNPQPFYSPEEIDHQLIRSIELFNATHLRTFRRRLYDAVEEADLLDRDGKWLETCTDVALMYPLLDQCWSDEVAFIDEPIYRYTRKHGQGTLARFGKPHKLERLAWLKSKPPKPRLHPDRRPARGVA